MSWVKQFNCEREDRCTDKQIDQMNDFPDFIKYVVDDNDSRISRRISGHFISALDSDRKPHSEKHTERFYNLDGLGGSLHIGLDHILQDQYSSTEKRKLMIVAALNDDIINLLLYKVKT